MADEIELRFVVPGSPRQVMEQWRRQPPSALADAGYELADESLQTLSWQVRYLDWPGKLVAYGTFGVGLLFRGMMTSSFRLTAHFEEDGVARTRVVLLGTAHPRTRAALAALADAHGGPIEPPSAATSLPGSPPSWPRTPPW